MNEKEQQLQNSEHALQVGGFLGMSLQRHCQLQNADSQGRAEVSRVQQTCRGLLVSVIDVWLREVLSAQQREISELKSELAVVQERLTEKARQHQRLQVRNA